MRDGYKIVDTDSHMMEPPDWLWERHMEDAYKSEAPRMGEAPGLRPTCLPGRGRVVHPREGQIPDGGEAIPQSGVTKAMDRFDKAPETPSFSPQSRT